MHGVGIRFSRLALAALAIVGLFALANASGAAAAASCDLVASPTGDDGNAGTQSQPIRSAQHLVDSLGDGQTGCFRAGLYDIDDTIEVRDPGITLTSYPGERATVKGLLKIEKGGERVTVSDLDIDGRSPYRLGPMVFAANVTFDNVDVTNYHTGICFILGAVDPAYGRAVHTVIENSRIHDCGVLPSENGDHGIYVEHADGTIIRNNWIYDNADRGIQLYPDSQGARIYGNVIDGNGEGVIFSGNDEAGSSNNLVYDNVISNSKVRRNVEESWSDGGPVGTGNVVRENCVWSSNATGAGDYYNTDGGILPDARGFTATDNVLANPRFVNRAAGNFKLRANSPCGSGVPPVTLSVGHKQVQSGAKVNLNGRVRYVQPRPVMIQIKFHGHWKRFARTQLRANGKFKVRTRLRGRMVAKRTRLRAWVPNVGRSKPVAIRIR